MALKANLGYDGSFEIGSDISMPISSEHTIYSMNVIYLSLKEKSIHS